MSETLITTRNLPNPHLFEPLFCTRGHHPSPYYYLIFEAIVQALIGLSCDDFYIEVKTRVPQSTLQRWRVNLKKYGQIDSLVKGDGRLLLLTDEALDV